MSRRGTRATALAVSVLVAASAPAPARAIAWPDVSARVERDLAAPNVPTRVAAARELPSIGAARGVPLALAALTDEDDDVRLAAADAAIRLRARAATAEVIGWLNAPDARLRREACDVARALPDVRAVAPLARTLGDPSADVRTAAAEALGNQAAESAVAPLLGRLDDSAPAVRVAVVRALARLGDRRAIVPLVGKAQDSAPEVRQAVARALGELGDARASAALVPALRDQNADVRREALTALGRLGAADAVDAIAPFASDRTPSLQHAAVAALGRIATPDALRVLMATLEAADESATAFEETPTRAALVGAGARALPLLHATLAGSPSPAAADGAAWVLGALRARTEAPTLAHALRRGVLGPAAALHALAGAGTSAEVPLVLEYMTDASPLVRNEAIAAAMALLDPRDPDGRAVEPLAAALRDAAPGLHERVRMALLLGRTGAPRAAPVLVALAKATDPALKLAAIDALGSLGPTGADGTLLHALGAKDPETRLRAATALASAGGPEARDAIAKSLAEDDEADRPALLMALGGILARLPAEPVVAELDAQLQLAAGPERDALLEALGRAGIASAVRSLARVVAARESDPRDRSAVAALLAAGARDAASIVLLRALANDGDGGVVAQAAWSLGSAGDRSDIARLETLARGPNGDAATNAAAALGRIAARAQDAEAAARSLCPLLIDPRGAVRANALAGLALAGARCPGASPGESERTLLRDDPREEVRAAAAAAVAASPAADDRAALERCAATDASARVAARCRTPAPPPPASSATEPVLVFVVPDTARAPRPGATYALEMADGLIHAGVADRRGAVFDPRAPAGLVRLLRAL
jgi:HEAT repeat protein